MSEATNVAALVSGVVRDEGGRSVSAALVFFRRGPVPLQQIAVSTGADGEFTLDAPAAGVYTVGCAAEGFAASSVAVTVAGGEEVKIILRLRRT